jgi:hypothetical protein
MKMECTSFESSCDVWARSHIATGAVIIRETCYVIYTATGVGEVEDLLQTVIMKYITMPHVISCFAYK